MFESERCAEEPFASAERECYKSFYEYSKYMDDETFKPMEREYFDWSGSFCTKCIVWFLNVNAVLDHEKVCKGKPFAATVPAAFKIAKPNTSETEDREHESKTKQKMTEEDVAGDFIHAATGQYKSLADYVPDHINSKTGYYKYGTRKCSKCKEFKQTYDFSAEELDKNASRRVCDCCLEKAHLMK